jgi:hypothetical protein
MPSTTRHTEQWAIIGAAVFSIRTFDLESPKWTILQFALFVVPQFAKGHGHYLCDAAEKLTPTFENFYDDCHFNTAGARRMGQIVSECFQDIVAN